MMKLLIGSSLAKELYTTEVFTHVYFLEGPLSMDHVTSIWIYLKNLNITFDKIYVTIGSLILPWRLHAVNGREHVCLLKYDELSAKIITDSLNYVLSQHGDRIFYIQPPPRGLLTTSEFLTTCLTYEQMALSRFRRYVNAMTRFYKTTSKNTELKGERTSNTRIPIGIISCRTILAEMVRKNNLHPERRPITAADLLDWNSIHYSDGARDAIRELVGYLWVETNM